MNKGLKIILAFTAAILAALLIWSISAPVKFEKERDNRYVKVISQLQDISNLQKEYKNQTGLYNSSIDSLISFADTAEYVLMQRKDTTIMVNNGRFEVPQDKQIIKILGRVKVKDSLFKNRDYKGLKNMNVGTKKAFVMDVHKDYKYNEDSTDYSTITKFKAFAHKRDILNGLNRNSVEGEVFAQKGIVDSVLSVGSLRNESTEGNWTPELGFIVSESKK